MTTYTTLTDATLSQDKPLTQSTVRALRDNPTAITEGASGAPRNAPASLNFPYFMATRTTNQNNLGNGVSTKVQINTEVYDPDSLYDNATNYRFTPNKPGLYRVMLYLEGTNSATANTQMTADIRKSGSSFSSATSVPVAASAKLTALAETIVQMNGTTDYLEAFVAFPSDLNGTCSVNTARFLAHAICES